jgi:serine phosphatase RsbU (regulator of sigma subunit)
MGSDGYQDQFGGDRGKKFTGKRLRQLLSEIHNLPMEEQHQELRDTFEMWKGDTRQTDDVLFIGLVLE